MLTVEPVVLTSDRLSLAVASTTSSPTKLVAQWLIVDGKLVCHWTIAER